MPRIRNWKDLIFYRPSKDIRYHHIDSLFCEEVINWELIQTHWQDLLLANAVILDNTFQLSKVLKGLMEEGWNITRDELAMFSPYQTHHIKRFGNYVMDLETLPQPIEDDLLLPV